MAVKNWTGKSQRSLLFYSPDFNYRIDFSFYVGSRSKR